MGRGLHLRVDLVWLRVRRVRDRRVLTPDRRLADVELDDRLLQSVLNINNAAAQPQEAPAGEAKVVNLFDEEG